MPALTSGVQAPEITLSSIDGKKFSLHESLKQGAVLAAFFKVGCPVCQLAFPYIERLFRAYGGKVSIVGISQNAAEKAQAFNREFGVTFPVLLDPKDKYPASNAYRLTNVPSLFLITPEGEIELSIVGWSKKDMDLLNQRMSEMSGQKLATLFTAGDKAPEFKPG
jgi:peroxiredoxin